MIVGQRIKERRLQLGLSQSDLAMRLNYKSRSSVNKIEMNINDITLPKVEQFAKALHTSAAYLMGWTDDPSPCKDAVSALSSPLTSLVPEEVVQVVSGLNDTGVDELVDYGRYLLKKPEYRLAESERRSTADHVALF